mmetsp:Transcript_21451/g.56014  ORF Transcript_21451/g.56014 Transcript_21451/m.56014 type:complete len:89 (+) Transcript_21451:2905-3171(+)
MLAQSIFPAETINRAKVPTSFNAGNLTVDNTGSYASARINHALLFHSPECNAPACLIVVFQKGSKSLMKIYWVGIPSQNIGIDTQTVN